MSSLPVYIGRWQDHSRSLILGDTVTLSVRWGGYLIAALSTFVGLVGSALWLLIAFFIHQYRASPRQHDGLFFQQQAVYRNQSSSSGALIDLFRVCWSWRPRNPPGQQASRPKEHLVEGRLKRSFFYSLPPLVVFVVFTAAGVFISEVAGPTYESNNVLVKSSRCGFFSYDTATTEGQRAENLKVTNDTITGRQYAKTCYQSNVTFSDCAIFPVQSLPFASSMVQCPFGADPSGENACIPGPGLALQMDTGLLDTNRYLGINAVPSNRLLFRNVVTCSPIRIHDYVQVLNSTDPTFPILQFDLGGIYDVADYTYLYDTHTRADIVAYQITPVFAVDGDQAWFPVSALNVSNADISAHFLAQNSVQYLEPVVDPWLSANQLNNDSGSGIDLVLWGPDEYVSVMACTDQYQICNPNSSPYDCTILGSLKDLRLGFLQIGLNPYQLATARRLALSLIWTSTYQTVLSLSNTALLARDRLVDYIGLGLPANQWQIEVEGWFATGLAKLQAYVIEYAANIADLGPTGFVTAPSPSADDPETKAALDQCSNQRIRNVGSYQSFSFLGLMIVICVGSTIILLSWIVEPLVALVRGRRHRDKHDYREVARVADHIFQLQRKAFQGAGFADGWDSEHLMDTVPVGRRDALFPAPTRNKVDGIEDYHYAALRTSTDSDNDVGDGENHGLGRPMAQVSENPSLYPTSPPPSARISLPREPSAQQPLLQHAG